MTSTQHQRRLSDERRHLEEKTSVRVRFQEIDATQVVWHGHYVAYFEDARRAFGRRFGIDYPDFIRNNVVAPLVRLAIDFRSPARNDDLLEVTARLCESQGAKLEFEYEVVRAPDRKLLATGESVQVFTAFDGTLMLTPPEFLRERLRQWEKSWMPPRKRPPG
jgi:acyl-CoA thioester hydrolase